MGVRNGPLPGRPRQGENRWHESTLERMETEHERSSPNTTRPRRGPASQTFQKGWYECANDGHLRQNYPLRRCFESRGEHSSLRQPQEKPGPRPLTPSSEPSSAKGNSEPGEWTPERAVLLPSVCRIQPLTFFPAPFITIKLLGMDFTALLDREVSISVIGDGVLE